MKPFLKWAGNKYKILDKIIPLLPKGVRLIEPFVGSAAVFLNTDYREYILGDANSDLITLYKTLQKGQEDFVEYAKSFFTAENNTEERYYQLRELFNSTGDPDLKSALFIYLNRHGYNGLCRYNRQGKFNVPFGKYKKPYFPEKELKEFIKKLNSCRVIFVNQDFEKTMCLAKKGDVIYCDPPYAPLTETANFTGYAENDFSLSDQKRLIKVSEELSKKGVYVLISNHHTDFTEKNYSKALKIIRFDVQRTISCKGEDRKKAPEILAVFA